jgi:hypothetical protein
MPRRLAIMTDARLQKADRFLLWAVDQEAEMRKDRRELKWSLVKAITRAFDQDNFQEIERLMTEVEWKE